MERQLRNVQARGRSIHRQHVRVVLPIARHHHALTLHLVAKPVREQRPDGAIHETRGQRFLHRRTPLAFQEAPGELARRRRPLAVVTGQRKEVRARTRRPRRRCIENHRLAVLNHDRPSRLLRQISRLQRQHLLPDLLLNSNFHFSFPSRTSTVTGHGAAARRSTSESECRPPRDSNPQGAMAHWRPRQPGPAELADTSKVGEDESPLLADFQPSNNVQISLGINLLQIVQQTATTADHHQQATPARVVFAMRPHVLREPVDPSRQNGDLHLWRSRIHICPTIVLNNALLSIFRDGHSPTQSKLSARQPIPAPLRPLNKVVRHRYPNGWSALSLLQQKTTKLQVVIVSGDHRFATANRGVVKTLFSRPWLARQSHHRHRRHRILSLPRRFLQLLLLEVVGVSASTAERRRRSHAQDPRSARSRRPPGFIQ